MLLALFLLSFSTTISTAEPIACSGAELQFERVEDNIGGSQTDLKAALAAKGLLLAEKLVGTGITIIPGSVILDEGTQPGAGAGGPSFPGSGGGTGNGEATPSAIFTGGAKTFGSDDMAEGIVLSTGNVGCRLCDNENKAGVSTSFAWGNAKSGNSVDDDFKGWCTSDCNRFQDMVLLEFKFRIEHSTKMGIKYVFTSEEWPKFVNPLFADSFAFFIGDANAQNFQNIALTPQGKAVSIETVNCVGGSFAHACSNCNLFFDNANDGKNSCPGVTQSPLNGKGFALKGMTKMLEGEIALAAGVHTIKLVIADARDTEKDSAVFVAAKSMTAAIPMCYTVVSKVCGEVLETFVTPVTNFPAGHPVISRTNCDGAPSSTTIPGEGKEVSGTSCGKEAGGAMLYAYDGTQSRSGYAKKGSAVAYVVRDSWKRAYLVIELGQSLKTTGYATMDLSLERVTGKPGILVKDDPKDDLQWDATKNKGRLKWNWKSTEGDGVVIGPFIEGDGWCLEWTLFEMGAGALDKFIFGSVENNAFVEKVAFTAAILENGVRLCGCSGAQDKCQACDKREDGKTCGGIGSGGGTTGGGSGSSGSGSSGGGGSGSGSGSSGGDDNGNGGATPGGSGTAKPASCTSGVVNAAGNGCSPSCSTGDVNAAGDGCKDPDAAFEAAGTFTDAGTFTPEKSTGGGSGTGAASGPSSAAPEGGAGGAVAVVLLLLVCCCCIAGLWYLRENKQGPFQAGGKLEKYGKEKNAKEQKGIELKNTTSTGGLPLGWEESIDPASGYPLYTNSQTGAVQWEKPAISHLNPMNRAGHGRNETQLPSGWAKDGEGNDKYYYNEDTGETTWDAPPGSVGGGSAGIGEVAVDGVAAAATKEELPAGWGEDFDAEGNMYWYNAASGETSWERPV
jgi:hypothetical protein